MKAVPSVLLLLILCAASAAGCGGGEESQQTKALVRGEKSRLTKAQLVKKAQAICKRAATEQVQLASHYGKNVVVAGNLEVVTAVFVPPMAKELRRLRALNPPQADAEDVKAIVRAVGRGVEDAKIDYLDLFFKRSDPFAQADALARRYGLTACAGSSHAVIRPRG